MDRQYVRSLVAEALDAAAPPPPAAPRRAGAWSLPPFFVGDSPPHAADAPVPQAGRTLAPGAGRRVAIGSDHGGFDLKRRLLEHLRELGYEAVDVGTHSADSCDYPDFAFAVGRALQSGRCALGIMIDGAGIGSAMALNKLPGIRAATVHSEATAVNSREHNDANVLVLGSLQMNPGHARRITRIWLATPHAGGRHARRVDKINALDRGGAAS